MMSELRWTLLILGVLFIAAHSERHTKQIHEVKADPNFPKN